MKIQVPADMNPEYVEYYCLAYWAGWKDYQEHGIKNMDRREVVPAAYDAGFNAAITATMNWKRRKR